MREIKFRAWNEKQGKMYEDIQNNRYLGKLFFNTEFEVMQYTGLKDKNGKEIYEGDIVKFMWNDPYISPVYWTDDYGWTIYSIRAWKYTLSHHKDTVEVIGNIYENPELVEGK